MATEAGPCVLVTRVPIKGGLVRAHGQDFDVGTPTVQLLLVLHRELQHQVLALVGVGLQELGADGVEACIGARLDTCFHHPHPRTQQQQVSMASPKGHTPSPPLVSSGQNEGKEECCRKGDILILLLPLLPLSMTHTLRRVGGIGSQRHPQ